MTVWLPSLIGYKYEEWKVGALKIDCLLHNCGERGRYLGIFSMTCMCILWGNLPLALNLASLYMCWQNVFLELLNKVAVVLKILLLVLLVLCLQSPAWAWEKLFTTRHT
jgi:hypothetical protein